ncbi:hypothetical protein Tco_0710001, partial [Tanacetum coccineum]
VSGSYGLPPTPARRALFIVYQSKVPYIAERASSRIASRGIPLSDELETSGSTQDHFWTERSRPLAYGVAFEDSLGNL